MLAARHLTEPHEPTALGRDLMTASGIVSSTLVVVAGALRATVPLTKAIGNLTVDPGIDATVPSGIAQAGTVALLFAMASVAGTVVPRVRLAGWPPS